LAIRYCLKTPEIIDDFPMDYLTDPFYQELLRTLSEKRKTGIRIEVNQIMSHFEDSEEVKKIVEFMMNEDEVSRSDYQDALEIMNRFYNEAQLDRLSEQIKRESSNGNDDAVARLTNQFIEIKKMMKENGRH